MNKTYTVRARISFTIPVFVLAANEDEAREFAADKAANELRQGIIVAQACPADLTDEEDWEVEG